MSEDKTLVFKAILDTTQYVSSGKTISNVNKTMESSGKTLSSSTTKDFDGMIKVVDRYAKSLDALAKKLAMMNSYNNYNRSANTNYRNAGNASRIATNAQNNQQNLQASYQRYLMQSAILQQRMQLQGMRNSGGGNVNSTNNGGGYGSGSSSYFAIGNVFRVVRMIEMVGEVFEKLAKATYDLLSSISQEGAKFEQLGMGLNAITHNAQESILIERQLVNLAKKPGIGITEAFEGYNRLRFTGASNDYAQRIERAIAKGVSVTKGGKLGFQRSMLAITETLDRPFASSTQLYKQLNFLPMARIIKEAFGVNDSKDLKEKNISSQEVVFAIVKALEKLETRDDTMINIWENISDAVTYASSLMGRSFNEYLKPVFGDPYKQYEKLRDTNVFPEAGKILGEIVAKAFKTIGEKWASPFGPAGSSVGMFGTSGGQPGLKDNSDRQFDLLDTIAEVLTDIELFVGISAEVLKMILNVVTLGRGKGLIETLHDKIKRDIKDRLIYAQSFHHRDDLTDPNAGPDGLSSSIDSLGDSIHLNTKAIKEATKLQERIIGGGSIGAKGVSAVEFSNLGNKKVVQAVKLLLDGMQDMSTDIAHRTMYHGHN